MTLAHRRAVDRVRSEQAASQRESRYGAANVDPPVDHGRRFGHPVATNAGRSTACLDSLTDLQRECIQLAYYDGLTYVQVSERLSANLATIKSRMRDAIRGLRNCLGLAMTEPTEPRPDRPGHALRAARDDRRRTRRHRTPARRRAAGSAPRRSPTRCAPCTRRWRSSRRRRPSNRPPRCATGCWPPSADDPVRQLPSKRAMPLAHNVLAAAAVLVDRPGRAGRRHRACGPQPATSTAEQVFAAPDVRTVSGPHPDRRHRHAGVLP